MNIWHDILELARHTPSPHNVQPWKFRIIDNDNALLLIDRGRTLPKEDLTGSFVLSAMTMMTESIALIAANRQLRLEVKLIYQGNLESQPLIPFAELKLTPDSTIKAEYEDALFLSRRTSRLSYIKKPISETDLAQLAALVKKYVQNFGTTSDQSQIKRLMKWNITAAFHDLSEPDYHGEISEYFRYTDKMIMKHRDGLDYKCMNQMKSELWLTAKAPWLFKLPVVKTLLQMNYGRKLGHTETIGWIAGDFWKPEQGIEAGRVLIRFWLETAKLGIYFHPLGNLVTNKWASSKIDNELQKNIWLIFRMGYSKEPPKSQRLSLQEIIID